MACERLNIGSGDADRSRVIFVLKRLLAEQLGGTYQMTPAQACGVVGNFAYESGCCDPSSYNPNDNGGQSGGIMHWHNAFLTEMQDWVKSRNNGDWKSLPLQVDFFLKADTRTMTQERNTWISYCTDHPSETAEEYAYQFQCKIERPRDQSRTGLSAQRRMANARTLYNWLNSSGNNINDCDVSNIGTVTPSTIVINENAQTARNTREKMTAEEWEEFCRKCAENKQNASSAAASAVDNYTSAVGESLKKEIFIIGDGVWGKPIADYFEKQNLNVNRKFAQGGDVNFATVTNALSNLKSEGAKHILFVTGEKEPFKYTDSLFDRILNWQTISTTTLDNNFKKIIYPFSEECVKLKFEQVGVMMIPPIGKNNQKYRDSYGYDYISEFNCKLVKHFIWMSDPDNNPGFKTTFRLLPIIPKSTVSDNSKWMNFYNDFIDTLINYCNAGWCAHSNTIRGQNLEKKSTEIAKLLIQAWNYAFTYKIK